MKKGFSLIELMIVVSIISALSTFSIYGIKRLYHQRQFDTTIRTLSSSLNFAQSISRASGFITILCPSVDSSRCDPESNWSNGWITYKDTNANYSLDDDETVINVIKHTEEEIRIRLNAPGTPQKIIFYRNGRLWPNGRFTVCHNQINNALAIVITQSGRVRTTHNPVSHCA